MSEINVLFGAPTGCTSPKNVRPGISPCILIICSYNYSPGAKLENGGLPYTASPLSFEGFNCLYVHQDKNSGRFRKIQVCEHGVIKQIST